MGKTISRLLPCCFGRDYDEKNDIDTDYITPKTIQPDIEHDTDNLDYTTDNLYDMRNLKYSTLDNLEHGTRIKYYVLNHGKRIHMV